MKYKGYWIESCADGTFDILDGYALVDGEYESVEAAQQFIDEYTS